MNKQERNEERYYRSLDKVDKQLRNLGINASGQDIIKVYKAELNSVGDLASVENVEDIQDVIDQLGEFA